jgi:hypothetical protein
VTLSDVQKLRIFRVVRKTKDQEHLINIINYFFSMFGRVTSSHLIRKLKCDHKKAKKIIDAVYKDEYDTRNA